MLFFFFEMPATHPYFLNFNISFACHSSVTVLSDLPCTFRLGNKKGCPWTEAEI